MEVLGQDETPNRFKVAVLVGGNISQIDGDSAAGYNYLGLNAGLRAYAVLAPKWELSIGAAYSQRGSRTTPRDIGATFKRIELDYIDVPLMLYFRDWKIQFGVGAQVGRLYRIQHTLLDGTDDTESYVAAVNPRKWDVAGIADMCFWFNNHFGLDFSYTRSLINISPNSFSRNYYLTVRGAYLF
jgi:hypothetical protein